MIRAKIRTVVSCLALLGAQATVAQTTAPGTDIDLKLFEKAEADRSRGCTVALWQANRDPEADKYAIVFIEALRGKDHAREPARMKIGQNVITLQRIAVGGKTNGYNLYEHQLYRLAGDAGYVVVDLKLGPLEGEAVDVEAGSVTVSMPGKTMFKVNVKGGAGCMTPAAPEPPKAAQGKGANAASGVPQRQASAGGARPADTPEMFERYQVRMAQVPKGFIQAVQKRFNCDAKMIASGITGYQMSEDSAIWHVPCEQFAYQSTAVFALVYLQDPATNLTFLTTPGPKGRSRPTDPGVLTSPSWDVRNRTVTSVALGRAAGDCGVLERYRVTQEGAFALVEYREKQNCDGQPVKPEQFPLVFGAR